jgi:glutaredoxin
MKYTIYSLDNCPWCDRAKALADLMKLDYEEIQEKHSDWPTVPYVLGNSKPIGGFTEFAAYCRQL